MEATKTYADVTKRGISARTLEWITDLVDRFGDERVSAAFREVAADPKVKMTTVISAARDLLAKEEATARHDVPPREVGRDELMAIVRGQAPVPQGPWIYSSSDLTRDEYREVVACDRFGFAKRHGATS